MTNYRRIYEKAYGSIPFDKNGRTYEIHHKDGNRNNNDTSNLIALSIEDHYKVHYEQGDWLECLAMSVRMNRDKDYLSEMNTRLLLEGNHPSQSILVREKMSNKAKLRIEKGEHHFANLEWQMVKNKTRLEQGTHNFLDKVWQKSNIEKQIQQGIHPTQRKLTCPVCNATMILPLYKRWKHGPECKK